MGSGLGSEAAERALDLHTIRLEQRTGQELELSFSYQRWYRFCSDSSVLSKFRRGARDRETSETDL